MCAIVSKEKRHFLEVSLALVPEDVARPGVDVVQVAVEMRHSPTMK